MRLRLHGADRVGAGGQWQGPVGRAASATDLPDAAGERRVADRRGAERPDRARTFYEQHFQDATLYFFDPTGRILVPEPVHLPQGQQLITALVRALLLGPRRSLTGVVRTFIPPGLTAAPLVVSQGRSPVTLRGPDPGPLQPQATRLMLTQLAWTLRQDPSVRSLPGHHRRSPGHRLDGRLDVPGRHPDADRYDPADPRPAPALRPAPRASGLRSGQPPDPGRRSVRDEGRGSVRSRSASTTTRSPARRRTRCWWVRCGAGRSRPVLTGAGCCGPPGTSPAGSGTSEPDPRRGGRPLRRADGAHIRCGSRDHRPGRQPLPGLARRLAPGRRSCAAPTATGSSSAGSATTPTARVLSGTEREPIRWASGTGTRDPRHRLDVADHDRRARPGRSHPGRGPAARRRRLDVAERGARHHRPGRPSAWPTSPASASLTHAVRGPARRAPRPRAGRHQPASSRSPGLHHITYAG